MLPFSAITALTLIALVLLVLWGRSKVLVHETLCKMAKYASSEYEARHANKQLLNRVEVADNTIARNNYLYGLELAELKDSKSILQEDLREARKEAREARNKLADYILSDITSIKFTANIPQKGWTKTEFKLGVGSCGKDVTALIWKELTDRYEIRQVCSDGERKEFTYFKEDVAGRIEMAYKAVTID